jgi:putative hemolysin
VKTTHTGVALLLALSVAGCAPATPDAPSPASVPCEQQGGTLEIHVEESGQASYCVFPDGSECEEGAPYRGECSPGEAAEQLPNPASVYCEQQGGTLEIRDEEDGQAGYCRFADGGECEEWAFFRGECSPGVPSAELSNPASVHCVEQGGTLQMRDQENGQVGYCVFPGGSECEEWAFWRGECVSGQPGTATPSPESALCAVMGGRTESRTTEAGAATYCLFLDGSACDERALSRGECWPRSRYQPLRPEECASLAAAMTSAWRAQVTSGAESFRDYVSGESGFGCSLLAVGTGLVFESYGLVARVTRQALAARGWIEDSEFIADGPTATAAGFRKETRLCLLQVGWEPSGEADCPEDESISVCEVVPEQQLYMVSLQCAQHVGPTG